MESDLMSCVFLCYGLVHARPRSRSSLVSPLELRLAISCGLHDTYITDITDIPDITNITYITDITDITDITNITYITDITDIPNITDMTNIKDMTNINTFSVLKQMCHYTTHHREHKKRCNSFNSSQHRNCFGTIIPSKRPINTVWTRACHTFYTF